MQIHAKAGKRDQKFNPFSLFPFPSSRSLQNFHPKQPCHSIQAPLMIFLIRSRRHQGLGSHGPPLMIFNNSMKL
jgi:hypothetical protein